MATEFLGLKQSEYFYCSGFCCYLGLICLFIHRTLLYNPGWPQTPISPRDRMAGGFLHTWVWVTVLFH